MAGRKVRTQIREDGDGPESEPTRPSHAVVGPTASEGGVNVFLNRDLLARIDERAASLNMPRSRYPAFLAKTDVGRGGALRIQPRPEQGTVPNALNAVREIAEFLAVPALTEYQRRKDDPQAAARVPQPSESLS